MEKKVHLQQWQHYNPLDKQYYDVAIHEKSNKYPYCKDEKMTSVENLLRPKISSVGVIPARETSHIDELGVMVIGKSNLQLEKQQDDPNTEEQTTVETGGETGLEKPKKKRQKMPAIVASIGTTTKVNFSNRKKPKPMPMTKLKGKTLPKPSLIPVPPNSRTSKRTGSIHSNLEEHVQTETDQHSEAPPSTPTSEKSKIKIEITEVRDTTSARSVDEIIKTLRSSREGKAVRSSSDIKIDQLMEQVMHHSEEWKRKEEDTVTDGETITSDKAQEATRRLSTSDMEEDADVSDTVSTLASQISAPAGIPDVAAILLRKSSEMAQRTGGDSDYSGLTTPIIGAGDSEEYVDAAQALKDLHTSLDVTNEDIIHIEGKPPPTVKYEPVSDDEGYFESVVTSTPSGERLIPADLTTTITTGGRIHHLCLLAADTSTQFDVSPSDAALSRIMHTAGKHHMVLEAAERLKTASLPPVPPPSTAEGSGQRTYASSNLPTVLEEVEKYNKETYDEEENEPKPVTLDDVQLDTSKIDPLDIEAWRRLADGMIEKTDFTQQGERCMEEEPSVWRLIWHPAPPKMLIPPVAVKAALFPKYHGTQLVASTADGKEELDMADFESDEEDESEEKKSLVNLIYLYRRHKSEEDLTAAFKKEPLLVRAQEITGSHRSNSIPDLPAEEDGARSFVKMRVDYSTAMEELRLQRIDAVGKEQALFQIDPSVPTTSCMPSRVEARPSVCEPKKLESTVKFVQPVPPQRKISEAEIARQGGREYISHRRSRRKSMKKSLVRVNEVRRILASYDPLPLKRSSSLDTSLPDRLLMPERPLTRRSRKRVSGELSRLRGRSLPRDLDFGEFLNHYGNPNIVDVREWVRDVWNDWFDEVIPPAASEEDAWSSSSSEPDDSEMMDADEVKGRASTPHPSSSVMEKQKLPTKVPDVLAPVVVGVAGRDNEEEEDMDGERMVAEMQTEVEKLSARITALRPNETATQAIMLTRRGAYLRKLGQIRSALEDLDAAISLEPRLATAYWHRHLIRLLQNKAHDALDDLNVLLKLNKQHVHAYRSRADVFASLGDFTMAIVNYSQAVKLNPNDEEAYFQRAQLYEKKGDMLLALEDYGSVVRINPSRTDALLRRGRFNFKQGNWHTTISDFTLMIQREPHNALARTYRGRAYAALKQYESALADLSASIHLDPLNWRAFYHRACLLRTLAPEKSLQDFSCSLLINDTYENAMALLHRGILYTEMKRFKEAVVDFEEALRLDHGLACAHVNIGLVHHQITHNYPEAIRHFTNALNVDPTYTRAYMCRSDSYEKMKEHKKALHDVTRAIVLCPDDRHLYLRRGQLLLQLGELKLAGFCVRHIATLGEGIVATSAAQQAVVQSFLKNHDIAINGLTAACRVKPVPTMFVLLGKTLMKAKKFKEAITNFKKGLGITAAKDRFSTITSHTTSAQDNPDEAAESHFLLGQCYTQMEKHSKALYAYNCALKANPNHALAYYRRGLCRLKMDHSKGVQDLNRALALDPLLFQAYLSRAAFYGLKGRHSKAILNCNEALRLQPQSVRALLYRGALKFYIRAYQLAVQDLTTAIKLERTCALAYFNRAVCFQRMKRYNEALKDYSIVLMLGETAPATTVDTDNDAVPLCLRVYVNRGLLYLRDLDDPHNAALDFESVTNIQPRNIRVLHTMAMCYHKLKMLKEAVQSYTLCLQVDPFFLAGYIGRGDAYADADDKTSSRRDYQRALKLDSTCVAARINLGYSLQSVGKFYQAWLQFSHAIRLDEKNQQAFEGRALTSLHAGSIEAAFQDVTAAFRAGRPTARLHAARGVIQQYMGDVRGAMADYQNAVKLDNRYAAAYFNAAALYLRDRRFREALAYLDRAVQLVPDDEAALLNRGIARVLLNDTEQALSDFNEAAKRNPKNAHIFYNRGNLLNMLKRYKEAEIDYTTAFTINPSDYGALKKRADIRGKLGNKAEAIADYKAALKLHERTKYLARAT